MATRNAEQELSPWRPHCLVTHTSEPSPRANRVDNDWRRRGDSFEVLGETGAQRGADRLPSYSPPVYDTVATFSVSETSPLPVRRKRSFAALRTRSASASAPSLHDAYARKEPPVPNSPGLGSGGTRKVPWALGFSSLFGGKGRKRAPPSPLSLAALVSPRPSIARSSDSGASISSVPSTSHHALSGSWSPYSLRNRPPSSTGPRDQPLRDHRPPSPIPSTSPIGMASFSSQQTRAPASARPYQLANRERRGEAFSQPEALDAQSPSDPHQSLPLRRKAIQRLTLFSPHSHPPPSNQLPDFPPPPPRSALIIPCSSSVENPVAPTDSLTSLFCTSIPASAPAQYPSHASSDDELRSRPRTASSVGTSSNERRQGNRSISYGSWYQEGYLRRESSRSNFPIDATTLGDSEQGDGFPWAPAHSRWTSEEADKEYEEDPQTPRGLDPSQLNNLEVLSHVLGSEMPLNPPSRPFALRLNTFGDPYATYCQASPEEGTSSSSTRGLQYLAPASPSHARRSSRDPHTLRPSPSRAYAPLPREPGLQTLHLAPAHERSQSLPSPSLSPLPSPAGRDRSASLSSPGGEGLGIVWGAREREKNPFFVESGGESSVMGGGSVSLDVEGGSGEHCSDDLSPTLPSTPSPPSRILKDASTQFRLIPQYRTTSTQTSPRTPSSPTLHSFPDSPTLRATSPPISPYDFDDLAATAIIPVLSPVGRSRASLLPLRRTGRSVPLPGERGQEAAPRRREKEREQEREQEERNGAGREQEERNEALEDEVKRLARMNAILTGMDYERGEQG